MAIATWPVSLPQKPSPKGYKEEFIDTSISTKPEVGPRKLRRRISKDTKPFSIFFSLLTSTQIDTLETFYESTLLSGTQEFNWIHPRTEVASVFRFVKKPSVVANGPIRFDTSMVVELMP